MTLAGTKFITKCNDDVDLWKQNVCLVKPCKNELMYHAFLDVLPTNMLYCKFLFAMFGNLRNFQNTSILVQGDTKKRSSPKLE